MRGFFTDLKPQRGRTDKKDSRCPMRQKATVAGSVVRLRGYYGIECSENQTAIRGCILRCDMSYRHEKFIKVWDKSGRRLALRQVQRLFNRVST